MANERILIVEDSILVAMHIKYILSKAGYKIIAEVTSGEEAVEVADRENPDLILMDIMLAGQMNGITASAIIQKQSNVPVIFLSAYSDRQTIDDAKATAPYSYIIKPFDDKDLLTRVELTLYKHILEEKHTQERIAALIEGQETERNRVSREIHDGLGQLLNAIRFNLDTVDQNNYTQVYDKIYALTEEAITESKRITEDLLPSRLLHFDIVTSIGALCTQMSNVNTEVIFQTKEFTTVITKEQKLGLYRITQECLQNAFKHAACSKLYVQLYDNGTNVHLSIEDNGKGFDKEQIIKGKGLNNLNFRVISMNGKIQIESNPNTGTLVSVNIPITNP